MTNPIAQTPYYQSAYPTGAINGLQAAYSTSTALTIAAGTCRDSTDRCNMSLAATVTINGATLAAANGTDGAALANSTLYGVYLIGDSTGNKATAGLVSTSLTAPILPAGYDMFRLVSYWFTDGSAHFWLGYYFGSSNYRKFQYDSAQSVLSGGTSTTYAAVDLSSFVPSISATANLPVKLLTQFTPNTAADKASLRPTGATAGTPFDITGVVTTKAQDVPVEMLSGFASSKAEVDYKVATSGSLTLQVLGFDINL